MSENCIRFNSWTKGARVYFDGEKQAFINKTDCIGGNVIRMMVTEDRKETQLTALKAMNEFKALQANADKHRR
jgi:hypothetical protein